ncbi:MAG: hypothetical protein C4K58_01720 [Flavobacteriaceae bacterium]|nr:MAG: hypothetical protein C4K58_01720 [Flavobacteriaceae bacterium]
MKELKIDTMDSTFVKNIHSSWAYVVVALILITLVTSAIFFFTKKELPLWFRKLLSFSMISVHIQFLIGMVLMFISPAVSAALSTGMGNVMKDSALRLLVVEHPMTMISAALFLTVANAKTKKSADINGGTFLLILVAAACVLSRIPWDQWHS